MARIENVYDGGSDGTAITTGNSGGASGTAFGTVSTSGGGAVVYDDDSPSPLLGTMSGLYSAATSGFALTVLEWGSNKTEVWFRIILYKTANPSSTTSIGILVDGVTLGCDVRITTTGTVQFRDGTQTSRYTSTALANSALHRIEGRVLHSTTVGRMEMRIYSGSNFLGSTPDQTGGSSTTNRNTGAQSDRMRFGICTTTTWASLVLDAVALDDTGWVGIPIIGSGTPSQASQTSSGDGTETIPGSGSPSQAAQTSSGSGGHTLAATGSGSPSQESQASSGSGIHVLTITGSGATSQESQVSTASGVEALVGSAAVTQESQVPSGAGVLTPVIAGSGAMLQASQSMSASGGHAAPVVGSGAMLQADQLVLSGIGSAPRASTRRRSGYVPPNDPAARRVMFDLIRRIDDLEP